MRNKILVLSVLIIVSAFVANAYAVSQNTDAEKSNQVQEQTQQQLQQQSRDENGAGNQIQNQEQIQNQNQKQNQKQIQEQQWQVNAQQHQSVVSTFVDGLLQVADREGGIGEQIRTIAQQQNQSVDTTVRVMEKVRARNKIKTLFFGSDYKNLGELRSEMVQTRNRLEQLNGLIGNIQNEGDKTELHNQIQTLEQEQAKIENFIKDNENKFSLFGWLVKLFNK